MKKTHLRRSVSALLICAMLLSLCGYTGTSIAAADADTPASVQRTYTRYYEQVYEAENAVGNGTSVNTDHTGYSGTGFVDNFNATGKYIDFQINIPVTGDYSFILRYWCSGSGSYHALIPAAAEAWGLPVSGCTASEPQRITDALSSGKLIVAIMSAGHFTSSGHFIVLRGVQDEKILVADPANRTRSEQSWDLSIILNEASKAAGSGGPFWIIG